MLKDVGIIGKPVYDDYMKKSSPNNFTEAKEGAGG